MDKNDIGGKRPFWLAHLAAWEKSGSTQTAYCREHNLSRDAFGWWRRKFRERPAAELPVLVQVPTESPRLAVPVDDFSGLRLVLPRDMRLEISRWFDPATLSRVVTTLLQVES
jgi:transposase